MSLEKPLQQKAAETLRDLRWGGDPNCVHCSSPDVVKNGRRDDYIQQYNCRNCDTSFNDRTGTVFSTTQMRLDECVYIIEKNMEGESVNQISNDLDRSWKTVNDFLVALESSVDPSELFSRLSNSNGVSGRMLESLSSGGSLDYSRLGCG